MYDGLHAAFQLRGIEAEGDRPPVGRDDTSSQFSYERVLEEAKAQSVIIYGIGLGDIRKSVLKELSEMTGGRSFFISKASQLADVYRKIAEELRRQYYLSYSTTNTKWDGRFIKLEVKSKNPAWSVRARRGYFAVRGGGGGGAAASK
jgi:VWFA-related protein